MKGPVLEPAVFDAVKPWAAAAAREHVSVKATSRPTRWFKARVEGVMVGILGIMDAGGGVHRIRGVWVLPAHRGKGYGASMTEEAIRLAYGELGAKGLDVYAYNPGFYEARGWTREGVRPNGAVYLRHVKP